MPKRALLIGINYAKGRRVLRGCANDVATVEKMQESFHYTIVNLINEQATYANILAEFTKLLSEAVSGDSLFFQFSGHVNHIVDTNNDDVDGYDEFSSKLLVTDLYGEPRRGPDSNLKGCKTHILHICAFNCAKGI